MKDTVAVILIGWDWRVRRVRGSGLKGTTGQQQKWRQRHQREGEHVDQLRLGVRLLTSEGHGCSHFDRLGLEGKVCSRKQTQGHDRMVTEVAMKASARGQTC